MHPTRGEREHAMKSSWLSGVVAVVVAAGVLLPVTSAEAAGTVRGTVAYQGASMEKITVGWFEPSTGDYESTTTTATGAYSLKLPKSGVKYVLYANLRVASTVPSRINVSYVGVYYGLGDKRDYAWQTLSPYSATKSGDSVNIELAKPGSVTGTDPLLARNRISLDNLGGQAVAGTEQNVYSGGTFVIGGLVPGRYRLNNSSPYNILSVNTDEFVVTEGTRTTIDPEVNVGGVVRGTATTPGGAPAADVYVEASTASGVADSTYTDNAGKYTLSVLSKSSYRIQFGRIVQSTTKTFVPQSSIVSGVATGTPVVHDVTLQQAARLTGTVAISSKSNASYSYLVNLANSGGTIVATSYVTAKGEYSFSGLSTGNYYLTVTDSKSGKYTKKTVAVLTGKTVTVSKLTLASKGLTLSGTVPGVGSAKYDYNNYVYLTAPNRPTFGKSFSKNGKFSLSGIVPGTYTVTVYATERAVKTYSLTITSSTKKNYAPGGKFGAFKGALRIKGNVVSSADLVVLNKNSESLVTFSKSKFAMTTEAGKQSLYFANSKRFFQPKSPFWVDLPASKKSITVKPGKTLNLGTTNLLVKR